jgi:cytoskeleton protein RodZ
MISDDDKKNIDDGRSRDLSPGKLLVWARERANLSQEQVAKELYMTLTKVRSLEMDDYRHMGADTFVRGYLRAYANLVHLDVLQLLAAYDRFLQKTGATEQSLPRKTESAAKPIGKFAAAIVILLAIIWLISIWFFDNRQQSVINRPAAVVPQLDVREIPAKSAVSLHALSSESPTNISVGDTTSSLALQAEVVKIPDDLQALANSSSADSSPVNSESNAVKNTGNNAVRNTESSTVNSEISSAAAELSAFTESSSESQSQPRTSGSIELSVLTLTFSAECWVEVSDANGDVLAADLQAAGSALQLRGRAPFDVKLGNALAANILLDGEPFAFTPLSSTNVLSLKVGQ